MSVAVPFPADSPPGYEWLVDDPAFDPAVHLQLEEPSSILTLAELGYLDEEIATKATPVAASKLEAAVAVVTTAVAEMRAGARPPSHYGG